jgi:hypothetical protein
MLLKNLQMKVGNDIAIDSAASTNQTLILNIPTVLVNLIAFNNGAANAFIKVFDKTTAPVTGTDTPIMIFTVPPGGSFILNESICLNSGLGLAITNLVADLDNTAVAAGQVKIKGQFIQ